MDICVDFYPGISRKAALRLAVIPRLSYFCLCRQFENPPGQQCHLNDNDLREDKRWLSQFYQNE